MSLKERAALAAADLVKSGMTLGLGTGSTASLLVRELGRRLREGKLQEIRGVPTSMATARVAEEEGIPLISLAEASILDMTLDGADEVDPHWNLIKGGGGCLLREKIVAQASRLEVILVDESKLVSHLGEGFPLPIEVIPFGSTTHEAFFRSLGGEPLLRKGRDGEPYLTDERNYIYDVSFGSNESSMLRRPEELNQALSIRAGVVETGLFLGVTSILVVAHPDRVDVQRRRPPLPERDG